jgi:N-acylneuraminate cytidylyltransferase
MKTLGVILARSGSMGLADKHLRPLLGPPVIAYTFDHARSSRRLDRIAVSSDCPQILAMAKWAGFEPIKRPAELATSEASVQAVMLHALRHVEASDPGFRADALIVLYGNVPVRGDGVIDRCIDMLETSGCDSVRTFCPVGKWNPAWMWKLKSDAAAPLKYIDKGSIHRRQDLEKLYLHDGAAVAVTRAAMLLGEEHPEDPHAFFGTQWRGIETAMDETVEIDHLRDLYWAEAVLRERQSHRSTVKEIRKAS